MSHISSGVEYGLHCLLYLIDAPEGGSAASARDLAALQGLPAEFLAKIFTKLQKPGLVATSERMTGGLRLARRAEDVSMLDVIRAIDGEKKLFDCKEIRGRCALLPPGLRFDSTCSIHAVMLEAEQRMQESLAGHSLASIAAQLDQKAPALAPAATLWLQDRIANRRS